ncbi:MAG: hypothetical protein K2Q10_06740, partial [Rhodospirillales bacterium]|nr:hypothetical protein [Rhodospirillales bacterium]
FFQGPFAGYDPFVIVTWQGRVSEMAPLWPPAAGAWNPLLTHGLPLLLAAPLACRRLRGGRPGEAATMAVLLWGMALFLGLAMLQMRWARYAQAAALVPWTLTLAAALRWPAILSLGRHRLPLRSLALAALLLAPLVFGRLAGPPPRTGLSPPGAALCDEDAILAWLARPQPGIAAGDIVMADVFLGPRIIWDTPLRAIGTPHIDTSRGILDTETVFAGSGEAQARAVLARRGAALLLACPDQTEPGGFLDRALREGPPPWLEPVALPPDMRWRMFRVRP